MRLASLGVVLLATFSTACVTMNGTAPRRSERVEPKSSIVIARVFPMQSGEKRIVVTRAEQCPVIEEKSVEEWGQPRVAVGLATVVAPLAVVLIGGGLAISTGAAGAFGPGGSTEPAPGGGVAFIAAGVGLVALVVGIGIAESEPTERTVDKITGYQRCHEQPASGFLCDKATFTKCVKLTDGQWLVPSDQAATLDVTSLVLDGENVVLDRK